MHASLVCRRRAELESDLSLALGAAFERAEVERAVHTHGGDMAVVLDELLKGSHAAGAVQGAPAAMAVDEAMQEAQVRHMRDGIPCSSEALSFVPRAKGASLLGTHRARDAARTSRPGCSSAEQEAQSSHRYCDAQLIVRRLRNGRPASTN